jgi:hypothetical protein
VLPLREGRLGGPNNNNEIRQKKEIKEDAQVHTNYCVGKRRRRHAFPGSINNSTQHNDNVKRPDMQRVST